MKSFDLAGTEGTSFKFDTVGATVTGTVIDMEELQQTDLSTGEPRTFTNGQPMMMYRISLQTDITDTDTDDGIRSIYLKGSRNPESQSSLAAVLYAVKKATGTTQIEQGGTLTLTYIGDGKSKTRGFNPPKLYTATYERPSMNLDATATVQPETTTAGQQPATSVQLPAGFTPDMLQALLATNQQN